MTRGAEDPSLRRHSAGGHFDDRHGTYGSLRSTGVGTNGRSIGRSQLSGHDSRLSLESPPAYLTGKIPATFFIAVRVDRGG